jgi:putative transposase
VYSYYRKWVKQGIWEAINGALLKQMRQQAGRNEQPSLGLYQSIGRTGSKRGEEIGVDGNKKVKGHKRDLLVDVMGWVLGCFVGVANQADVKAAPAALAPALEAYERLEKVLGDHSYRSESLSQQVKEAYGYILEVVQREGKEFVPEAFRWVVERTFSWLDNARVLCRDYEKLLENHEGMIYVVMIRLMLRRQYLIFAHSLSWVRSLIFIRRIWLRNPGQLRRHHHQLPLTAQSLSRHFSFYPQPLVRRVSRTTSLQLHRNPDRVSIRRAASNHKARQR